VTIQNNMNNLNNYFFVSMRYYIFVLNKNAIDVKILETKNIDNDY